MWKTFGETHPEVAVTQGNLGRALAKCGRIELAEAAALTALGPIRRCLAGMGLTGRAPPIAPPHSAGGFRLRHLIHFGTGASGPANTA